jgi:hypothetical protein
MAATPQMEGRNRESARLVMTTMPGVIAWAVLASGVLEHSAHRS